MNSGPLDEEELEWLDEILLNHGNDDSVLDVSELDGMLTAILSGPNLVPPSIWLTALWGGEEHLPEWPSADTLNRFMNLVLQHMNDISDRLNFAPDQFEPMFGFRQTEGQEFTVVEEWCFGYLRGVALDDWSALPTTLQPVLEAIALHGKEENFPQLDTMTPAQWEDSQAAIAPAALQLHQYWLTKRQREIH
ncbi:UPF0149 family protein [Erwinia psidii]|uniref:YecA family protein n=1 Tax=Erwinia psidii TaxID=69224 RepID=A0A3N6RY55_9GAMM|nr:UPF0149 family protein [Erwinia psidii]MCX8958205.1 YecA family protein [Erwinia psidii]MCX8963428.1 YecA family protein [Erwinia psidii]MCX8966942.1 YecA family protein [Erwinia psidii]RQM38064.1 YecA family protein [Erwinia psidii]